MWGCSERLNSASRYSCSYKSSRMLTNFLFRRMATSICSSRCFKIGFIVSCSRNSLRHLASSDPYDISQARRTSSGLRKNIFEVYVFYKNIRSEIVEGVPFNAFSLGKGHQLSGIFEGPGMDPVAQDKQGLFGFVDAVSPLSHTRSMSERSSSLTESHPAIAKEAYGWDPNEITSGSNKTLNWKCPNGHIYDAKVKARTAQNSGCPFCAGRRVLLGFNDLTTTHPNLAEQANGWDPRTISAGSHKRLSWVCKNNHEWKVAVYTRAGSQKSGCPYCSNNKVFAGFNDLATTNPELIIEADGWDPTEIIAGSSKKLPWICSYSHRWFASVNERAGTKKTGCPVCSWSILEKGFNDLKTIDPILANEANGWDPSSIIANSGSKKSWKCKDGHVWEAQVNIRQRVGTGCPVCSNNKIIPGINDLATTFPTLAAQANGWDSTTLSAGSQKKVSWKCSIGHVWEAVVASRTTHNNGCPYCGKKVLLKGFNDIATVNPEMASEADGWNPSEYISGTSKRLKWKCSEGHKWEVSATSRLHLQSGCPFCSNNKVLSGVNDLKTTNPELALEADGWDPTKFFAGSESKMTWKCSKDERHIWQAKIYSRLHGKGCPFCSNQKTLVGVNDLATTNPDLAQQAHGWDPRNFTAGSERILEWTCSTYSNHIWRAAIKARTRGTGCPYCSHNKLLQGFNDFATRYPELASQAVGWDPTSVITGTGQKLQWRCPGDSTHIWRTSITSRIIGSGCPTCNPLGGFNPLEDGYLYFLTHPHWGMLQIGITNDPKTRLQSHSQLGWETLEVRGPMDGYLTRDWETSILKMLKLKGATLGDSEVAGRFDGYTEAWLEETFPAKSLRDLMDYVEELEEAYPSEELPQ